MPESSSMTRHNTGLLNRNQRVEEDTNVKSIVMEKCGMNDVTAVDRQPNGLDMRSISKAFGSTRVLHNVSLHVAPGEVHALMGQNGSGKSTLIKVLSGFHQADPGAEATVSGKPCELGDPEAVRDAGVRFVHQDLGLVPALSVVDNLALGPGYETSLGMRINWRKQAEKAEEALAGIGYHVDVHALVEDLQPVERTAVAIARALHSTGDEMSVLVLDEPTATMPKGEVERLLEIINNIRRRGVAILYVSHHLDEVFRIADRVTVLVDGRVAATRKCADLDERTLVDLMTGGVVDTTRECVVRSFGDMLLSLQAVSGTELVDLDLNVRAGEVVGIAGITGSGREELCSLIFGARNRRGIVEVGGEELAALRPSAAVSAGMAMVPASRLSEGIVRDLNVRENINLASLRQNARRLWIAAKADRRRAWDTCRRLSVKAASIEASIESLSGGNQQKVVLGKWLQTAPRVLLLDEPTQGVDVGAKAEIHRIVDEAASRGVAVLVCSSDEAELERLCDRVLVLREGRVAAELSGSEITSSRLVYLGLGTAA